MQFTPVSYEVCGLCKTRFQGRDGKIDDTAVIHDTILYRVKRARSFVASFVDRRLVPW